MQTHTHSRSLSLTISGMQTNNDEQQKIVIKLKYSNIKNNYKPQTESSIQISLATKHVINGQHQRELKHLTIHIWQRYNYKLRIRHLSAYKNLRKKEISSLNAYSRLKQHTIVFSLRASDIILIYLSHVNRIDTRSIEPIQKKSIFFDQKSGIREQKCENQSKLIHNLNAIFALFVSRFVSMQCKQIDTTSIWLMDIERIDIVASNLLYNYCGLSIISN